jgi:hypothetical protein
LDCPSDASSFVAEANIKYGINIIGCDPLFDKDPKILEEQGEKDIEYVVERVSLSPKLYKWDYYLSVEGLRNCRKLALKQFIPHYQQELPNDMLEAWHRARDIMYTDKTDSNVRTSKIISKYLSLLKDMHDYITSSTIQSSNKMKDEKLKKIEQEYNKLAYRRGAVIQDIVRIERTEESRFLFEDADFSYETIKKLIAQGYDDVEKVLKDI